ncbi:MAG: DUF4349 domain-containing protein [Chitinophagales bacterium]
MSRIWLFIKEHKLLTALGLLVLVLIGIGLVSYPIRTEYVLFQNTQTGSLNEEMTNDPSLLAGGTGGVSFTLPNDVTYGRTKGISKSSAMTRKVIQSMSLSLEVKDVSRSMDQIVELAKKANGYVVFSSIRKNQSNYRGNIEVKIPNDKLLATADRLTKLGNLRSRTIETNDVTEEYYDSQTRLRVLKKKEERLISFMDRAQKVSDLVTIEDKLNEVRSDIEVLEGRLKYLDNETEYSSININLIQGRSEQVVAPKGTWGRSLQGFVGSINKLVGFLNWLVITVITLIPYLIVLAILGLIVYYIKTRRKKESVE